MSKDSNLKVVSFEDAMNEIKAYYKANGEPGRYVGYEHLNNFYTHKDGGVTDWTGFPGSGKTYFCLQLLLNLSIRYGKRHMLFVPDIGSTKEIYAKLLKMYTGKDITDKYNNQISDVELLRSMPWIHYHFVVIEKSDFKQGVTPVAFWEMVCEYKDNEGKGVDTGLMDSWKNLKHLYSGREDVYLDEVLAIRNELAERHQKHFHTIAHAVKTELSGEKGEGKRRIPTAWDIKGGGSWYANGKSIITVDFPNKFATGVNLYISKVKPEDVGKVGDIVGKMKLDPVKGQYYEIVDSYNYFPFMYEDRPKTFEMNFGDDQPPLELNIDTVEELPF